MATIGAMGSSVVTGMMLARLVGDPIVSVLKFDIMVTRFYNYFRLNVMKLNSKLSISNILMI